MLQSETQIPVYFSYWNPEIQSILEDIDEISPSSTSSSHKGTAAEGAVIILVKILECEKA